MIKKSLVFIAIIMVSLSSIYAQDNIKKDEETNIIILTLSGVRNSESIDDPDHQYMPHMWNDIIKEGTLYTKLATQGFEFHMPQVQAINSGKTYSAWTGIDKKTIFEYIQEEYDLPRHKLWSIGTWYNRNCRNVYNEKAEAPCILSALQVGTYPLIKKVLSEQERKIWEYYYPKKNEGYLGPWTIWDSINPIYYKIFKKILKTYKPKFVHYVMNDTECAHFDSYAKYVVSLKNIDKQIYEIWNYIQTSEFYRDNTYLFVIVDHQRDPYYSSHKYHSYDNPSSVWMWVYGPDIRKNHTIDKKIYHTDIFATCLNIMNIDKPMDTKGRVLKDMFKN